MMSVPDRSPAKFRSAAPWVFALGVFALGAFAAAPAAAEDAPEFDGKYLFEAFCSMCHAPNGGGGPLGPSLLGKASAETPDEALVRVITVGRISKAMPMFGRGLARGEIKAVVAYIRTLQNSEPTAKDEKLDEPAPIEPSDNSAAGETLFFGRAGCGDCHTVYYEGGYVGPNLTGIAGRRSPADIYEAIADPNARVPRAYRPKVGETMDGEIVTGLYRDETADTVQIQSADGLLWRTYFKKDFKSLKTSKESVMPPGLLDDLSEQDAKDLLAYLVDLK